MRAHRQLFSWYFVLASLLSISHAAISLSQFQQVAGFSQACTNAYNTPLTGCAATDFVNGDPCSSVCIEFLKRLTISVQKACKGTLALPGSLMDMLLSGQAVAELCPNVLAGSEPLPGAAGGGDETGSIVAGSTSWTSSATSLELSVAETPTSIATAKTSTETLFPTPASSATRTTTSFALAPLDTSTTMMMTVTEPESTPTILPPDSTIPLSVLTGSPSKSTTTIAKSTSSNKNSNGNPEGAGGGTLFDLTSASCRMAKTTWWVGSIPAGVFILACLL